jgi:hypothetical protein
MPIAAAPACLLIAAGSPCWAQTSSPEFVVTPAKLSLGEWSRAPQESAASPDAPSDTPLNIFHDDPESADGLSPSKWRVELTTWVWLIGVDGNVGARGFVTDVSADFGDILDASDSLFAYSGRIEVGYGAWAVFIDSIYIDLGADNQTGPGGRADVDVTYEQLLIDFGVKYRVGEWEPTGNAASNSRNTTLDLYAGGRYNNIKLDLEPSRLPSVSRSKDWIDPIFGASAVLPFAERWHLLLVGDIGGFGVNSDLTWATTGVVGFDFTIFNLQATLFGGYRAVGYDYTDGSGRRRFTWDVIQHGPIFGLGVTF